MRLFVALLTAVPYIAATALLVAGIYFGRHTVHQIEALSYATTTGTITRSNIEIHQGRRGASFSAAVGYTYRVEGKDYFGNQYRYGGWFSTLWRSSAERIVAELPVGKNVTVYYALHDPERVKGFETTAVRY